MSLYVEIVQRQGLEVIFHVVWFSLQERVVWGLVAGLQASVFNHAQCNSLMMDTQYPKHVEEEMIMVCFMF
jgi:hypothetical protein